MVYIRGFVHGKDEEPWVRILNEAFREYEDFRPWTVKDFREWENGPYFDVKGMFIAEVNRIPVGCVEAYIDRKREEKKGFIRSLAVLPEYSGSAR